MTVRELVDASGVPLRLAATPRRIVCLIPSITETLCALGLADAIVGVSAYCTEPQAVVRAKVKVGGEKNPDLEKIRALEPDLVVANIEENVREHVETLRRWSIPVWVTYPRTLFEAMVMIRQLGTLTGTEAHASALVEELEDLAAEARASSARRLAMPVFYPIWRNPWMTISADTYIHDVLATVGARNVFADRAGRYPVVTLDEMAALAPEVIVLPDEPFRFRQKHVADFDPYPGVPAVRDRRIHLMDGKLFCWYGPRLADALRTLPALFAP